ncbi:discoidin domain-containing protein [Kutzneria sp. CA-103260]|uniref:discoidin domain-containing protein n=1 Tax=Kutzneria sp. CA-103260 TaxID=2802641 RepID=UPI001BA7252D|nr:carbohydrate-binding protein [Kutzneria sp. CA-103260]QUQ64639.1 alpha-L-fucosidase [Kutzneria sp. CA-103260]
MRRSWVRRLVAYGAAMLVAAGLVAVPTVAHAELQNPRQDFLRASQAGLFLHWGERTSPVHTDCTSWENDVTSGGWSADYWVNEAKKLHAQYIVLATFHSKLGYTRPWPSAIPGSCHSKRDFLGELIAATKKAGMKTILYMTNDPQWHNDGLPAGKDWLDSKAFSSYAGHNVDLTTTNGFGEFSYDNFMEVMDRYPDLGGFWIDNDSQYWLDHNLYEQIRAKRPNYTLSNNNEDTPIMDMVSNEQKTGMTPSYDYPQAVWTAAPRLIEADYKLPDSGSWWYTGTDSTVDTRLNVGRYIANSGSSIKSLMDETAMVNGKFPGHQLDYNNFLNSYLDQIWGSINGTEGGGYMYGGLQPGFWNDGSQGVTTISKTNPDLQFIHVLTKPSGSTVKLRDNGYRVTKVTNFRTGAAVSFTQGNGYLTLTGLSGWDPYDTVFQVDTNGRTGVYPASTYTMSATASASGHAASAAADGDYLTYWDNKKTLPVSLTYNLGSAKRVQYIGINQREDSVSYARSSTEQSARIKAYKVYVSANGTDWGNPVTSGTLPSHRGVQFIDLPAGNSRYVKLEVDSTWAASSDSTHYKLLRIDDSWIGSDYAGASTTPPAGNRYEAEAGTCQGTVDSNHAGYSGTGFCNTTNATGSYAEWTGVHADAAGNATLKFHYANGTTTNRPAALTVNGTAAGSVSFAPTTNWDTWADATMTVPVTSGANTIRLTSTDAGGTANLDYLELTQ